MRDVAEGMGYDASHITALVDQLEARELVERRPDPTDRRVKRIVVTPKGDALRDQMEDELLATMLPARPARPRPSGCSCATCSPPSPRRRPELGERRAVAAPLDCAISS